MAQLVQFVVYLGSYDPANPLTNYLADFGFGFGGSVTNSMSFNVPANSTFVVVVVEEGPGTATGCQYSLAVTGTGVTTPVTMRGLSAAQGARGVTVRWRTASEPDLLGFHVYRQVGGRVVKLSRRLIAARGGGVYSYVDRSARPKQPARYWVQAVHVDGSRTWHGPVRVRRS